MTRNSRDPCLLHRVAFCLSQLSLLHDRLRCICLFFVGVILVFIDMIPVLLLDFLTLVPLLLFFERVVTLGNAWNQTFLLTVIDGSFFIGLFYHFFRLDNFQFVLDNAVFGDNLVLGRYFLSFEKHLLELLLTS